MREATAPIGDHRLIGDGWTTALVRPDGEIDWWCAPTVDAPPLLWSLLDADGAASRWEGAVPVSASSVPAGPTARTRVRIGGSEVECWDGFLAPGDGGPGLVRLVRCMDGPLDAIHTVALGGFDAPWSTGGGPMGVTGGEVVGGDGRWARLRVTAERQQWAAVAIAPAGTTVPPPVAVAARFAEADEAELSRIAGLRLPRSHPERAAEAMAVLRACTSADTGAVLASPVTSLPEAPGADRQFDYRYSWLRDGSLAASVAAMLGDLATSGRYLRFVVGLDGDGVLEAPVRTVRGTRVSCEREVPGVAGWKGSLPIRVGNAAAGQLQYDVLGMVLEAVWSHVRQGGRLDDVTWAMARTVADRAAQPSEPGERTSGIWELRRERDLVSADIGRWVALDRAVWLARHRRPLARRRHWIAARRAAKQRVTAAIRHDGGLPQTYDGEGSDGSALLAVVMGMFRRGDPRAARLVDATLAQLREGPFVRRYPTTTDDGFAGREGAFVPVSWWAVSALARLGRVDDAGAMADRLCEALPRLMPEEADPATGEALGNTPLVWSHMEVARAMHVLDRAGRHRRWLAAARRRLATARTAVRS